MSLGSITWQGPITATSSIAHGGQTRGTTTLLRRELIATPDGALVHVPVISGNSLRGRLRRVGEELLREVLHYEGQLSPAAAHALRGGGALAKTSSEPLSGSRLATLRALVPQISVFGTAGGGTIIDGALDVGKITPHLAETTHITGVPSTRSAFSATQLEHYTRHDDTHTHAAAPLHWPTNATGDDGEDDVELASASTGEEPVGRGRPASADDVVVDDRAEHGRRGGAGRSQAMVFTLETYPAGTVFSTWIRLRHPTELEVAFFTDLLATYQGDPHLGGRVGIGHGRIRLDLAPTTALPDIDVDWRQEAISSRTEILTALQALT